LTFLEAVAAGVLLAATCAALKEGGGRLIPFVLVGGGLFLFVWALLRFAPTLEAIRVLGDTPLSPYLTVILRAIGIGYVARIGGDICRDLGHEGTAQKLELCAKAELLAISLPYLVELISVASKLAGGEAI
jgi:stage III sporulation protein AD